MEDKHVCEEKLLQEKRRRGEREGREGGGREEEVENTREGERKIKKENCCTT